MTNKETTSNGIKLKNKKVSQSKIDNFDLSNYLVGLLWHEPFYSRILRSLNKIETTEIPTAGVLCKDGNITLWWNREFLASLKKEEIFGLLKHECLHLVYHHTTERRKLPHLIWNYSTDLAINSIIPYNQLPKGGLVPGRPLPRLTKEDKEEMTAESIEFYNHISNFINNLEVGKTSEYYFQKLMQDEKIKEKGEQSFDVVMGDVSGIGFDDHENWDSMSEDEKELIKEKIQDVLKDAVNEANSSSWGSVPHNIQKQLNEMVSRKIDWKAILKRFCGIKRRDERSSSNKRLSRKYPFIHPGIRRNYKPMIAVYIDESGSVTDKELQKFYSELNNLSDKTDFYVYRFDTQVNNDEGFLWKKGKKISLNRSKCGGTCFNSVTKHALKNKKKFDGYIIFTDGCAPKPKESNGLKRCWLLIENYNLMFEPSSKDTVIQSKNS